MERETVTIFKDVFNRLCEDAKFLEALRAAGVDNWQGYEYAQEIYNGEDE